PPRTYASQPPPLPAVPHPPVCWLRADSGTARPAVDRTDRARRVCRARLPGVILPPTAGASAPTGAPAPARHRQIGRPRVPSHEPGDCLLRKIAVALLAVPVIVLIYLPVVRLR